MGRRLIGSDGGLYIGSLGAVVSTGDLEKDKIYLVVTVGAASALPTGCTPGFFYIGQGETLATGDSVKPWNGSQMCDITTWGLEFSKDMIDVSTFCSTVREKRAGKTDCTGTIEGVFTSEVTSIDGGFLNQFLDIVRQNPDGTTEYSVSLAQGEIMLVMMYADIKANDPGEIMAFYAAPIELTGFSASAGGEDAQAFSSPFGIAPNDDFSIQYVEYTIPAAAP